jgi:hypothetical protein
MVGYRYYNGESSACTSLIFRRKQPCPVLNMNSAAMVS